jgi:hypothetical protein
VGARLHRANLDPWQDRPCSLRQGSRRKCARHTRTFDLQRPEFGQTCRPREECTYVNRGVCKNEERLDAIQAARGQPILRVKRWMLRPFQNWLQVECEADGRGMEREPPEPAFKVALREARKWESDIQEIGREVE